MKKTLIVAALLCVAVIAFSATLVAKSESDKAGFFAVVSRDFFPGLDGDRAAMDRAMKTCEDALAENPKHAQAMAWQGAGWVFLSSYEFNAGHIQEGKAQYIRGMSRLDEALALAPKDPMVLITHGMTWLKTAQHVPQPQKTMEWTAQGVNDLETALDIMGCWFNRAPADARGMILSTLASGLDRLDRTADAAEVYERIVKDLPGTPYAAEAQKHLKK